MLVRANQTITQQMLVNIAISRREALTIPKGRVFRVVKENKKSGEYQLNRKHTGLWPWWYLKEWFDVISE